MMKKILLGGVLVLVWLQLQCSMAGPGAQRRGGKSQAQKTGDRVPERISAETASLRRGEHAGEANSGKIAQTETVAGSVLEPKVVELRIQPLYVNTLFAQSAGYNYANPVWNRRGDLIAVERSRDRKKEIVVLDRQGRITKKIYYKTPGEGQYDILLAGLVENHSYNAGVTWAPGDNRFVFMSNAGEGNYDLYLETSVGTTRLTRHREKDAQPHWSPVDDRLIFVSSRSGKSQLYLLKMPAAGLRQLTSGSTTYLHPQWSPDGRHIALTIGSNRNHDILLIRNAGEKNEEHLLVAAEVSDDFRPVWSPDGTKLAYYSNRHQLDKTERWELMVAEIFPRGRAPFKTRRVADNVVPDINTGPAWMPDNRHILYIKNEKEAFLPVYICNIDLARSARIETHTKINHDLSVSPGGEIAFRAQFNQWDRIYLTRLKTGFSLENIQGAKR